MKKQLSSIDITKFVCALLIVILHVTTYGLSNMAQDGHAPTGDSNTLILYLLPLCYVILRIAVPFFFIASSFLLFKKIINNPNEHSQILKNYYKRIFLLWLFWFVISLPYTIDKIFIVSNLPLSIKFVRLFLKLLLQGGFDGAWYLWSSIISVFFVDKLTKNNKWKSCLTISLVFYLLACILSSYFNLFNFLPENIAKAIITPFEWLSKLDINLYQTFLSGTIFVFIGKLFAQKGNLLPSTKTILIGYPIFAYTELFICTYFSLSIATDFFLTLLPFSIAFFQAILNWDVKPKPIHKQLRICSTFIYLYHFVFLYCFYRFCGILGFNVVGNIALTVVIYLITVSSGILLCALNQKLSKKNGFKFLQYSY